jgi:hypothetical protein
MLRKVLGSKALMGSKATCGSLWFADFLDLARILGYTARVEFR